MCGRYNFTAGLAEETDRLWRAAGIGPPTDEVRPTDLVPVLVPGTGGPTPVAMAWGFPRPQGGVVINARSETVTEKAMFRDSVLARRCVVPSTGFYEWSRQDGGKTKYLFRPPGTPVLYMAGIWNTFREADGGSRQRFVILTTAANRSLEEDLGLLSLFGEESGGRLIHDRMPVVLTREETGLWLAEGTGFASLFDRRDVPLEKEEVSGGPGQRPGDFNENGSQ